MTVRIDRRLLILACAVLAVHVATLWMEISKNMPTISLVPAESQAIKVTFQPPAPAVASGPKTRAIQQIVQTDQTGIPVKPKDTAFLGEKDMAFDRQTVARKVDVFNKAGRGAAVTESKPVPAAKPAKKTLKDIKLSDLGMPMDKPMPERQPASVAKQGVQSGDEKSQGLSSTNDYVEHVALGDFTQLNTVEYKYYGFYHRIRQKLEQFWGKSLKEKAQALYKSGRRLPASDLYTTSLRITMNTQGEIVKVQIQSSSGVRELDEAATESFNEAGPFPNPPQGMLVNGQATIEWGFVVKS
jgi:TonB family protein